MCPRHEVVFSYLCQNLALMSKDIIETWNLSFYAFMNLTDALINNKLHLYTESICMILGNPTHDFGVPQET